MSLKYTCPFAARPLGYKGLCWKCRSGRERRTDCPWTPEQISEKQKSLIQNIQRLGDVEALELTDFRQRDGLIYPLLSTLDSSEASNPDVRPGYTGG